MKRFGVILLVGITLLAMKRPSVEQFHIRHIDSLMIVSYNVENLFDTIHDERINDVEFTPEGLNIGQVIVITVSSSIYPKL